MEEPSGGEAPVPQDAIALEASNKRLHAVAKKLKALLDTTQEELSLNKSRVSELELAARASTTKSVLSTLLGVPASEAEGLEARVAARVPIVEPSGETRVWCCITAPDGTLADWIPEDDLLSRVPRFATPVRQCELHTTPGEAAALRARVAEPVEELRKYRVRAEALLRQRDAELATARERVAAMEGGGGGGGGGSGGVGDALGGTPSTTPSSAAAATTAASAPGSSSSSSSSSGSGESLESLQRRLNEAHSQAQRLLAARGDLLERERAAKEGEEEACREAALARKEASLWQAKWAEAVGAAPPGSSASAAAAAAVAAVAAGGAGAGGGEGNEWLGVDGLGGGGGGSGGVGSSSTSGSGSSSCGSSSSSSAAAIAEARAPLQLELTKTQGEYLAYRRRAVAMIKEKDDQMKRLAEDMSALKGRLADASAAVAAANAASNAAAASSQLLHHHHVVGSPGGGGGDHTSSSSHTHNHHPLVSSPLHSPLPLQSGLGGRVGGGAGAAGTPPTLHQHQQQHTPGGTATTIPDLARWLYLRALLLKYLGEGVGNAGIRKSLEPPLFMVLGLSPSDVAHVLRSRASAAAGAGVAGLEDITAASPALGQAVSAVSGTLTGLWSLIGSAASNAASAAAAAATATGGGGSGSGSGSGSGGSGSVGGLSFGGGGGNGYGGGGQGQEGGAGGAALAGLAAAAGMPPASTLAQPQAQVDYALELLGNEKQ